MRSVVVEDLPPVFTHARARTLGLSDRVLYQWRDEGTINQLARGIFTKPHVEADPDLLEIAIRAPYATLCLTTSLSRHGLIDEIPPMINVALPRRKRTPRTSAPVTWHRFDENSFEVGRTSLTVLGEITIGIYGPVRSIVDAFRLTHLYGPEQAVEALKRWIKVPGNQASDLLRMAGHFPVAESPIRRVLEILL
ncbi:MAG: hypothetical protein ISR43_04825 [Acidimicrobiia bacterium]|nr:hypothetical protein [Actinomycetota bacterium]MBL6923974.1 hypothetical protein [Acidimicrobiia bacterium]MBL6926535.1 hypothetical protein [Acidimicrobiia bacterium]